MLVSAKISLNAHLNLNKNMYTDTNVLLKRFNLKKHDSGRSKPVLLKSLLRDGTFISGMVLGSLVRLMMSCWHSLMTKFWTQRWRQRSLLPVTNVQFPKSWVYCKINRRLLPSGDLILRTSLEPYFENGYIIFVRPLTVR